MNAAAGQDIDATNYDRAGCATGVVHLGFGAFHRAHQAVYLDDYMAKTGDLNWGVAAVNLRGSETDQFKTARDEINTYDGYYLKSVSAKGQVALRKVRCHLDFVDWSEEKEQAEALLSRPSVNLVTITVTESGYYTDPDGDLNLSDPLIASEISGDEPQSVYGYLRAALKGRMATTGKPLTIACCDNIRQNGKMLRRNLIAYLRGCNDAELADWVEGNVAFPCSMVDRITPRSSPELSAELSALIGSEIRSPILAEDFVQWVLEDKAAGPMPDLARAGVTVTSDVDPYEETKIRVLNGGHTCLAYLAALEGIETFDQAMAVPHLYDHFHRYETDEVLAALTLDLPFSKEDYLASIAARFGNKAICDTVARICADGMAKFSIFIRPTLEGCLAQGIMPRHGIASIASWYVFAQHVAAKKIAFDYVEPSWEELKPMLTKEGREAFVTSRLLWGELPETYPDFARTLRAGINEMEQKWPV